MTRRAATKKPAPPAKPKRRVGAPSIFTPELAEQICEMVASGMSIVTVAKNRAMPSERTIMTWLTDEVDAGKVLFQQKYARAREIRADRMVEEALELVDDVDAVMAKDGKADHALVAHQRLRADTRKWYASKLFPGRYGDKVAVGGASDLPPLVSELSDNERAVRITAILASIGKGKDDAG